MVTGLANWFKRSVKRGVRPKRAVAPYRAVDSGRPLHEVLALVNAANFECYGSNYRLGAGVDKIVVGSLIEYERLLKGLIPIEGIRFLPHRDIVGRACAADEIICGIRHDVDSDIRAALMEAEIEHSLGIRTTYYILHTAAYYGTFIQGVFHRNGCLAPVYRQLQELGHEVALHTDPLHVYQNLGGDGAEALCTELEWLRSEGIEIIGTVAHNSAPVYGAENYAIFKGRSRANPTVISSDSVPPPQSEVVHNGKWAPLQVLDERQLGLTYEGNDVFLQTSVPVEYAAIRAVNRWRRWSRDPHVFWFTDQDRLLEEISRIEKGCYLILSVHPLYYGARHDGRSAPPMRVDRRTVVMSDELGWEAHEPSGLCAASGDFSGEQEFQAINFANELGMIDLPMPPAPAKQANELRVVVLGGTNLAGPTVAIPEHCTIQAERLLAAHLDRPVVIRTLAHPGMGLSRLFGWFEQLQSRLAPDVVVLGIGADEIANSLPEYWARATGWRPEHPPGEWLRVADGEIEIMQRSGGALIRRGPERALRDAPSLIDERADGCELESLRHLLGYFVGAVRDAGAMPLLMLTECGESRGLWRADSSEAANRLAHDRCASALQQLAAGLELRIVDPYKRFLDSPATLPAHWRATPQWNYTGHRLAAEAMFEALAAHAGISAAPAPR